MPRIATRPTSPSPSPPAGRRSVSRRDTRSRTATRRAVSRRTTIRDAASRRTCEPPVQGRPLGRFLDAEGRPRELLARAGHGGSVLVLDRDASTLCDRRLVAHLAADEPPQNVALVCRHYLDDIHGRWCRPLEPEDLELAPFAEHESDRPTDLDEYDTDLPGRDGELYRLAPLGGDGPSIPHLRWCRRPADAHGVAPEPVSLRDVVAAIEDYEPARTLTARALSRHRYDPLVSVTLLHNELSRCRSSRIVLNRGLREAVLEATRTRELSLSEIASRCGMVKRDRRGRLSGETSWLARRIGLMPEGGERAATPWVHSDVLGLIARRGLNIAPREVELG